MNRSTKRSGIDRRAYWIIQGFDGLTRIGESKIDSVHISVERVQSLLQVLAGRAGLTLDEIVAAHLNGRSRAANGLLKVKRDGARMRFTCGENPHFIALLQHEGREPTRGAA